MGVFRTHNCGELRAGDEGSLVTMSGWLHQRRDHGGIVFVDLRDRYGLTQIVFRPDSEFFESVNGIPKESVIRVQGTVARRSADRINSALPTGEIEVLARQLDVMSTSDPLPFATAKDENVGEPIRLKYRFLDLRSKRLQDNIVLRSRVMNSVRRRLEAMQFVEVHTPILTRSSPEGARDYLVPSRLYPGKFYALPQAPQMFKQLLMVAGLDRYFQIAPCFRDEDARADRSPGEFYQIDLEMSFVEQEDVLQTVEQLMYGVFTEFTDWDVNKPPFPRIPYKDALLRFGTDKPDLRINLEIRDVTALFADSQFRVFRSVVEEGGVIRAIPVSNVGSQPRRFFDDVGKYVRELGGQGVAWILYEAESVRGSIATSIGETTVNALRQQLGLNTGDAVSFIAGKEKPTTTLAGQCRTYLAEQLQLRQANCYRFCWIIDFPMYEYNDERGCIEFSHNPFSMPQGGLETLNSVPPLEILAHQYDLVCNDLELSSGAIRNHSPEIMYRAFEIAGYGKQEVDDKFSGLINAFRFGAPPHGGLAPGLDRIVMLLAREPNIREVIAFPMNQNAQDMMMGAPSSVTARQLEELHIAITRTEEQTQRS